MASRIRLGIPREMNYAIMSMDGVFEDDSFFFAGFKVSYYIPLYTKYDVKIMLEEFGYYVPINPLQWLALYLFMRSLWVGLLFFFYHFLIHYFML